jgi:hypothetical protein
MSANNTPDINSVSTTHVKDNEKNGSVVYLKPKIEKSEIVHDDFLVLVKDTLLLPPSYTRNYSYYKLETNGLRAVSVVARIKDTNKYLILHEYRYESSALCLH